MIIGSRATLDQIANGFYETLRLALVALEHLPNITEYADLNAYKAAKDAIKATGVLIDVSQPGSNEDRDRTKMNIFYINEKEHSMGSIGGGKFSFEDYVDPEDDKRKFRKMIQPARTRDIGFEIRYKNEDKSVQNIMTGILGKVFGERKTINSYNDDGTVAGDFLINYRGTLDMADGRKLDKRAMYVCLDMLIYEPDVAQEGIPEMTDIQPIIDQFTAMSGAIDIQQFIEDGST